MGGVGCSCLYTSIVAVGALHSTIDWGVKAAAGGLCQSGYGDCCCVRVEGGLHGRVAIAGGSADRSC